MSYEECGTADLRDDCMVRALVTPNHVCPGWLITRTGQSSSEVRWICGCKFSDVLPQFPPARWTLSRLEPSSVHVYPPNSGCQVGFQNQVAICMPWRTCLHIMGSSAYKVM